MKKEQPIRAYTSAEAWREWLEENHTDPTGIWMQIFKKGSGVQTVTYAEALDEALCFGWIDGQKKSYDELSFLQKFTPRRARSVWSKRNREHIARLTDEGRMTAAGFAEVDAAKADGRWDDAYDAPSATRVPDDFIEALKDDEDAYAFFLTLNKANTYAIAWRLQSAKKPETRQRRMANLLELMKAHKKLQ